MNNCACVYVEHDGGPEFCSEKIVKARKTHTCGECLREIKPGEKYEDTFGVWEGNHDTHKTCLDCLSIRSELFCDCWFYERMWEDIAEHIAAVGTDILSCDTSQLTKPARDRLLDLIEDTLEWEDE
jgi:hypothetical protein